MNKLLKSFLLVVGMLCVVSAYAQSAHTVQYMVTYDLTRQRYTAWVIPQYATPNVNNPEADEYGSTAQVSIRIPRDFSLSDLQDNVGVWDKQPRKLGTETVFITNGSDTRYAYYVIGKTPSHTKYGQFAIGVPIALFSFKCVGAVPGQVEAISNQDTFVNLANKFLSLNVGNSFYSASGQPSIATARPQEQFNGITNPLDMMKQLQTGLEFAANLKGESPEGTSPLIVYPNPTQDVIQIKVFSEQSANALEINLLDAKGINQRIQKGVLSSGINTLMMDLTDLPGGTYYIKTILDGKSVVKTVIKM